MLLLSFYVIILAMVIVDANIVAVICVDVNAISFAFNINNTVTYVYLSI